MNPENYVYVDIFDIPDVMKVRIQYKIANEVSYRLPIIKRDAVVKLAEEIQPFVHNREKMDWGTYERTITDTLFVIPPDCKRLAIPKPESEKENEWIPFSERMPEEGQSVLLSRESVIFVLWWDEKRWERDFGEKPLAWMPLPKPYDQGAVE